MTPDEQAAELLFDAVNDYLRRALADIVSRVVIVEARINALPMPRDGRDGQPGVKGEDGKNGLDGLDGKDGLGFDDVSLEYDGEQSFVLKFQRGEQVREFPFRLPVPIDRGVFKADVIYSRGDCVSYGGSLWIAQKDAPFPKPGDGNAWRLAVKRGQDGKDASAAHTVNANPAAIVRLR